MNLQRRKAIRSMVRGLAAGTGLAVLPFPDGRTLKAQENRGADRQTGDTDGGLSALSAWEAISLMRSGELSAEDYATALISRFNDYGHLNVFISRNDDALLENARRADLSVARGETTGLLHGLPILIKDNIETADLPTSGGTPALQGRRTNRNAGVAKALFDAGALLAGKSNLHELAAGGSIGCVAGQVLNPYDHGVRPGGSSSGNGAALAARLVPAAIGTDTGGSVRIPASLCSVSALRPTFGRYSSTGILPISSSRDTAGPMARCVKDLALLDGVISGGPAGLETRRLEGMRLGVPRGYCFSILDPGTASVTEQVLALLEDKGVMLIEADIAYIEEATTEIRFSIAAIELGRDLPAYLDEGGGSVTMDELVNGICNPQVRSMFEHEDLGESQLVKIRTSLAADRKRLQDTYQNYFSSNRLDAVVFPTTPLPARPVEQVNEVEIDGRMMSALTAYNRNTMPGSSIGLPGVSIPAGVTADGLPVGLGLDGLHGTDRSLLAVAAAIESALEAENGPLPAPGELA